MITLTTDYGLTDPFVGVMKGVILGIHPEARIIDLTHGIPPQDIQRASFIIADSFRFFPRGSIHVVVVDPGVGTHRRPIAVSALGYRFIAPDNGVLTEIISMDANARVYQLNQEEYFLDGPRGTFDGRDVFAPIAAWLDKGKSLEDVGEPMPDPVTIDLPTAEVRASEISGQVIHIDSFGNAITNIRTTEISTLGEGPFRVKVKGSEAGVVRCYEDGACDILHALINSSGLLEVFLDRANAAETLGIKVGDTVTISD
jgi:hypothetical protein